MLKIKNASAVVNTAEVLKEISLEINPGEIHAIMGPKASGKSMLAQLIQGGDHIKQTEGSITFNRKNIATSYAVCYGSTVLYAEHVFKYK